MGRGFKNRAKGIRRGKTGHSVEEGAGEVGVAPTRIVLHAPHRENRVSRKGWWPHGTCLGATLRPHWSSEFKNTPHDCHLGVRKQRPPPHQPLHSQGLQSDPWNAASRTRHFSTTFLGAKQPPLLPSQHQPWKYQHSEDTSLHLGPYCQ